MTWRMTGAAIGLLLSGVSGWAQPDLGQLNPLAEHRGGLRLNSVSIFGGYSSLAMPNGASGFLYTAAPLGADINYGGQASVGWTRDSLNTRVSLTYSPSYTGRIRHSEWNALNHSLSFSVNRKLGRKWDLSFGLNGSAMSLDQYLFTPTVLSSVSMAGASFEQLAAAMLSGQLTNDQLASLLTGAPVVESPAASLIYGQRMLSATASTSLRYSPSTRLSLFLSAGASRAQYLNDGQSPETARYRAIVPRAVGANAGAGFTYKVTPRTDLGADVSASRTFSQYQDSYVTNGRITLGRKMSQRWFLSGYGGAGKIVPVRETVKLTQGPQYIAGGSIGFRTRAHTFVASIDRSIADRYGLGAQRTLSSTGAWFWHIRGGGWQVSTSGSWQQMQGGMDLRGWSIMAGVSRALTRETSMQASYAYMNSFSGLTGYRQQISVHSVRLALAWAPGKAR